MSERDPRANGNIDPTPATRLYDTIQEFVKTYSPAQLDSSNGDEQFVEFIGTEHELEFPFHVAEAETATFDSLTATSGYAEIGLQLWDNGTPIELDSSDEDAIDNFYSVVLVKGEDPFLVKFDEIDSYFSSTDGQMHYFDTGIEGAKHYLEMARLGEATMRVLDDPMCMQLLEAFDDPELLGHVSPE